MDPSAPVKSSETAQPQPWARTIQPSHSQIPVKGHEGTFGGDWNTILIMGGIYKAVYIY